MTPMGSNAMYSPLEAFDFDYLSFGLLPLVKNVWAWTAVIAAAVSLWRFKAVAVSSPNVLPPTASSPSPPPRPTLQDEKTLQQTETHACETTPAPALSPVTTLRQTFDAGEAVENLVAGTTKKEKFSLYYATVEKEEKEKEEEEEEEEEEEAEEEAVDEWRKRWGEVLRTRRGQKQWYRYQHLRGLNRNVVRLWDGNRRFARMG